MILRRLWKEEESVYSESNRLSLCLLMMHYRTEWARFLWCSSLLDCVMLKREINTRSESDERFCYECILLDDNPINRKRYAQSQRVCDSILQFRANNPSILRPTSTPPMETHIVISRIQRNWLLVFMESDKRRQQSLSSHLHGITLAKHRLSQQRGKGGKWYRVVTMVGQQFIFRFRSRWFVDFRDGIL